MRALQRREHLLQAHAPHNRSTLGKRPDPSLVSKEHCPYLKVAEVADHRRSERAAALDGPDVKDGRLRADLLERIDNVAAQEAGAADHDHLLVLLDGRAAR